MNKSELINWKINGDKLVYTNYETWLPVYRMNYFIPILPLVPSKTTWKNICSDNDIVAYLYYYTHIDLHLNDQSKHFGRCIFPRLVHILHCGIGNFPLDIVHKLK